VCLNCQFYDLGAHHACRESEAEWVREKDMGTFCSYFVPAGGTRPELSEAEQAMAKLAQLFSGD
jgi:hypothetical protein